MAFDPARSTLGKPANDGLEEKLGDPSSSADIAGHIHLIGRGGVVLDREESLVNIAGESYRVTTYGQGDGLPPLGRGDIAYLLVPDRLDQRVHDEAATLYDGSGRNALVAIQNCIAAAHYPPQSVDSGAGKSKRNGPMTHLASFQQIAYTELQGALDRQPHLRRGDC